MKISTSGTLQIHPVAIDSAVSICSLSERFSFTLCCFRWHIRDYAILHGPATR